MDKELTLVEVEKDCDKVLSVTKRIPLSEFDLKYLSVTAEQLGGTRMTSNRESLCITSMSKFHIMATNKQAGTAIEQVFDKEGKMHSKHYLLN